MCGEQTLVMYSELVMVVCGEWSLVRCGETALLIAGKRALVKGHVSYGKGALLMSDKKLTLMPKLTLHSSSVHDIQLNAFLWKWH